MLISCNDGDVVVPDQGTLLFEKSGLVDSVVVYGCYAHSSLYEVPDTLLLNGFSKLRVEFDGNVNSDGTIIFVYLTSLDDEDIEIYKVRDISEINKLHSLHASFTFQKALFKIVLYINPPVCGQNEFKYNRVRDLKIYGIK